MSKRILSLLLAVALLHLGLAARSNNSTAATGTSTAADANGNCLDPFLTSGHNQLVTTLKRTAKTLDDVNQARCPVGEVRH